MPLPKKRLKLGHCPNRGGGFGGLGRMADVLTSLVGENGIAEREKSHYWKRLSAHNHYVNFSAFLGKSMKLMHDHYDQIFYVF